MDGSAATVNLGNNANLTDNTSGSIDTTGGNSQVNLYGNYSQLTTGTGCTDGIHCVGDVLNTSDSTVSVDGSDSTATIDGSGNNITAAAGSELTLEGTGATGDTVTGTGIDATLEGSTYVNLFGSNDAVTLTSGDALGAYGGANTVATGAGNVVYVSGTNGAFDTVNATGAAAGGTTVTGQPTGIELDNNAQVNLEGGGNSVYLGTGDSLGAYGGGNTISVAADDDVYVTQTNGAFDTLNATNDVGGLLTANGQLSNIALSGDAQANLIGSGNTVSLGTGASLGAYGGGNTISVAADDDVYVTQTNGAFDTLNATNDVGGLLTANGQLSGISEGDNTQINVVGNGDTINAGATDTTGVFGNGDTLTASGGVASFTGIGDVGSNINNTNIYEGANSQVNITGSYDTLSTMTGDLANIAGGGNTIYTGANTEIGLGGTNGVFDAIYATNDGSGGTDENGTPTGIYLAPNAQVNLMGSGNLVGLGNGDSLGAYGGGNTIDTYAGDLVVAGQTNGNFDTIYATGDAGGGLTANGQGTGIDLNNDTQVNLFGSSNQLNLGTDDVAGAYGGSNTVSVNPDDYVVLSQTGSQVDTLDGSGDAVGGTTNNGQFGTGVYLDNGAESNFNGSNNSVTLLGGGYVGILSGTGDAVSANGDTINTLAGTNFTLNGSNDQIGLGLNGSASLDLVSGGGDVEYGSNDTVNLDNAYLSTTIVGSNDTANTGNFSYDTVGFSGTNETADLTNGTVNLDAAGDSVTINGSQDGAFTNSSNNTFVFNGVNDRASAAAGTSAEGVTFNGSNEVADVSNSTVVLEGQYQNVTVNGSGDHATTQAAYDTIALNGNQDVASLSSGTADIGGTGNTDVIVGSADDVSGGQNDSVHVDGNGDTEYGSTTDQLYVDGTGNKNDDNTTTTYIGSVSGDTGYGIKNDGTPTNSSSQDTVGDQIMQEDECPDGVDPVILNFQGSSVQTQALSTSTANFDMQDTGVAVHTGWATAGEGFLVDDPTNTAVTQDSQLVSGFGALSQMAGQDGGMLDASNPLFDQLRVWVDTTGDGQFAQQDLYTLQQLGITSINLSSQSEAANSNGNVILNDSSFTRNDGTTGDIAGVELFYAGGSSSSEGLTASTNTGDGRASEATNPALYQSAFSDVGTLLGSVSAGVLNPGSGETFQTNGSATFQEAQSLYAPSNDSSPTGAISAQTSGTIDPSSLLMTTSADQHTLQHAA